MSVILYFCRAFLWKLRHGRRDRGTLQDFACVFIIFWQGSHPRIILGLLRRDRLEVTFVWNDILSKAGRILDWFFLLAFTLTLFFRIEKPSNTITHRSRVTNQVQDSSFTRCNRLLTRNEILLTGALDS